MGHARGAIAAAVVRDTRPVVAATVMGHARGDITAAVVRDTRAVVPPAVVAGVAVAVIGPPVAAAIAVVGRRVAVAAVAVGLRVAVIRSRVAVGRTGRRGVAVGDRRAGGG